MACPDGNCNTTWNNLCSYIGQICINIETVIGNLIRNQHILRGKIEYEIVEVEDYPDCSRVYLDTELCAYTDTPNENTIPIGSHMGGGFVAPEGNIVCSSSIGLVGGVSAGSCQPLDDNLDPIIGDSSGAYAWTLTPDDGDCTPIIIAGGGDQCQEPTLQVASHTTDVTHPAGNGGSSIILPLTIQPNCETVQLQALVFPEEDMTGVDFMRVALHRNGIQIGVIENYAGTVNNLIGDHGMHLNTYIMNNVVGSVAGDVFSLEVYAIGNAPFLIRSHDFAANCFDCP